MRQDTVDKINARLELAQERHGKFSSRQHAIDSVGLEVREAEYALRWQSPGRFVAELLDIATVAVRAAEQLSSDEAEVEAAKPKMPDDLWIPAITGSTESGFCMCDMSIQGSGIFHIGMLQRNTKSIAWSFDIEKARAIRDWLNQFIAASEAGQ